MYLLDHEHWYFGTGIFFKSQYVHELIFFWILESGYVRCQAHRWSSPFLFSSSAIFSRWSTTSLICGSSTSFGDPPRSTQEMRRLGSSVFTCLITYLVHIHRHRIGDFVHYSYTYIFIYILFIFSHFRKHLERQCKEKTWWRHVIYFTWFETFFGLWCEPSTWMYWLWTFADDKVSSSWDKILS